MKNVSSNLGNLKNKVDKSDVYKLVPAPVDLSKLSDVVKYVVVKKDVYNTKIKSIEDKIPNTMTTNATNTILNARINEVKWEIPSITNLATTSAPSTNEVKSKIPNITNLTTTTAFTATGNKIPNVNNLVKKNLTITQKFVKLKIKLLLIMMMINVLLLKSLAS